MTNKQKDGKIINTIVKMRKRNRIKKFDFMKIIVTIAEEKYIRKSPNVKYSHYELLTCLIHFASTHVSWSKYKGTNDIQITGKYLNSIHLKYIEKGVYDAINKKLLEIYLQNNRCAKLKYQSIDSSFIPNKRGIHNKADNSKRDYDDKKIIGKIPLKQLLEEYDEKELIEKKILREYDDKNLIKNNRYNGRKKYVKISHLTDINGVVLGSYIFGGATSDFKSVTETINKVQIELNTKKYSNNNKYKQYLLADSGYDSKKVNEIATNLGYTPIIKPNNRNTGNKKQQKKMSEKQIKNLLEKNGYDTIIKPKIKPIKKKNSEKNKLPKRKKLRKFTTNQKKIYKKRQIVESSFAWAKDYPIINQIYQKTMSSHNGLLQLVNSLILSKKIVAEHMFIKNKR